MEAKIYWSPRNAYYTITENAVKRLKSLQEIKDFLTENGLTWADVISRHGQCDTD